MEAFCRKARHRLAVSERYLTRCFGQETGLAPVAYLNRYRVQRASEMLQHGQLSVIEIALACGFSDSSYFGRVFQRKTGEHSDRGEQSKY